MAGRAFFRVGVFDFSYTKMREKGAVGGAEGGVLLLEYSMDTVKEKKKGPDYSIMYDTRVDYYILAKLVNISSLKT